MQTTFLFFSHNLNYALGWTVVHSLWQATLIALLSGVLMIALRKKAAKTRYLVSNLALFSVLVAAIVTFFIYFDFTKEAGQVVFVPDSETVIETSSRFETSPTLATPTLNSATEGPLSIDGLKAYFNRHIYLIVTIWAMGVALFMLRLLGSISYVYYLKSRLNFPVDEYWQELLDGLKNRVGVQKGIELLESAMVRSPIVIGHLKPVILFPIGAINRLNPDEVEAILAHELAHILRNDYVFNIIQSVIEALFYFHPAVWWISAQIRNERENCCDDMAIELCGNAMNYAKSLVSVQEMAYYSPQMAMAFAGKSNKNQLLLRVQRVLNQPQTKTNVREKLTATCVLVALMISLAFSSNRLNQKENDLLNSTTSTTESSSETTSFSSENDADTEGSLFLKYLNKNNELDSLPMKYEVKDGAYNFSDATQNVDLTVKNNSVTQFNINGLEVASADIPKFEKLIKRILMPQPPLPPVPPTPPSSPMFPPVPPVPPTPPSSGGFSMQNNGNHLDMNENGLHLNGVDDNGKPIHLSVDENGLVMNSDGVKLNLSGNQDTYEEDAKPIEGLKNYNSSGQLMTIVSPKGVIQNFNTKGELTSIFKPNGVVKNYQNKKLTTVIKNGKKSNFNQSLNKSFSNKNKDPYNTLHLKAENGFTYVNFTLNGVSIWKCYRNENALGDLKLIKNKPYFDGHEASSEELKRLGLLWYNNSLNPLTGGFQIITNDINGSNHSDDEDEYDEKCDDCLDNLKEHLNDLQSEISDLVNSGVKQKELKELANQLKELQKKTLKKDIDRSAIRGFDAEFRNLKTDFKEFKNNCNCGEKNGFNYSFTSDENDKRKYKIDEAQIRRNAEQAARNAEQAVRNAEQNRRNAEQIRRNNEHVKRNAEQQKRNTNMEDSQIAKDNLFRSLVNEGYLSLNKKCTVKFDSDELKVNGKALNADVFKRFKADYEKRLKTKIDYHLTFKGVIDSVSETGLHMTGSFTYSVSDDN
jgi:beta-lactamase regulating signal transducer with metallopeptidase domain